MNLTKILLAGLVGAIVAFFLGWLSYGLLLNDFFATNAGSATGVGRGDEMLWVPMILGHLAWGVLFAYVFGKWASISTFATGLKGGAILGFLIGCTFDLISYGSQHVMNLTSAIVDIIVMTIVSAIIGGVVGWMLGRGN